MVKFTTHEPNYGQDAYGLGKRNPYQRLIPDTRVR